MHQWTSGVLSRVCTFVYVSECLGARLSCHCETYGEYT